MIYFSNIIGPIQKAIIESNWEWKDIAHGQLLGTSTSKTLFGSSRAESYYKWCKMAYSTYKMHNRICSLDRYQLSAKWVEAFKYSAIVITALNFQTVLFKHVKAVKKEANKDEKAKDVNAFRHFSAEIWKYTPKVLAVMKVAFVIIEFPKKPIQGAVTFVAAVITWTDISNYLPEGMSAAWNKIPLASRIYLFYKGGTNKRIMMIIKATLHYAFKHC